MSPVPPTVLPSREPAPLPPFQPPWWLRNGRWMTLASLRAPDHREFEASAEARRFEVAPETFVTGAWHAQPDPEAPAFVLQHGLGGSIDSGYMIGTARVAHARGFAVLRLNARNCGGTEALSKTTHHGALWQDAGEVIRQLGAERSGRTFHLAGFSLGGSLSLQLALRPRSERPAGLRSVCAVSPPLDLAACSSHLETTWLGRLAGRSFTNSLKAMVRERARHHGPQVDDQAMARARTVREFDALVTAPLGGFSSLDAYYRAGSVAGRMDGLDLPTRVIHALDDPLIPPGAPTELAASPPACLDLHLTPHGGHVAFRAARPAAGPFGPDPDRCWAESRVVDFAQSL